MDANAKSYILTAGFDCVEVIIEMENPEFFEKTKFRSWKLKALFRSFPAV